MIENSLNQNTWLSTKCLIGLVAILPLHGCSGDDVDTSGLDHTGEVIETGETSTPSGSVLRLANGVPSNFLIVSVDTLRADFTYGGIEDHSTPFLQELMADALVLQEHVSCSNWTVVSLYCILTGRSTEQIGIHPFSNEMRRLPEGEVTMAELFQQSGRDTSLLSANPLFTESLGLTQGFASVQVEVNESATTMTTKGLELVEQHMASNSGAGWFSQIHYYDPHGGYHPPSEFLGDMSDLPSIPYDITTNDGLRLLREAEKDLTVEERGLIHEHLTRSYGGEVRYLDYELKRLFSGLDSMGALDDTLVLFVSDHGEQLLEHGAVEHLRDLFREELHVPAFFWMKDQGLAPGVWSGVTSHQDLLPSVLSLFDLIDSDIDFDGDVVGYASPERVNIALHGVKMGSAVFGRLGEHELIYRWDGDLELYNLTSDPGGLVNLFDPSDLSIVDQIWPFVSASANALSNMGGLSPPAVPPVYHRGVLESP